LTKLIALLAPKAIKFTASKIFYFLGFVSRAGNWIPTLEEKELLANQRADLERQNAEREHQRAEIALASCIRSAFSALEMASDSMLPSASMFGIPITEATKC
jgi:hypothetical protein